MPGWTDADGHHDDDDAGADAGRADGVCLKALRDKGGRTWEMSGERAVSRGRNSACNNQLSGACRNNGVTKK